MKTKVKKGFFWGGIIASVVLLTNVFHSLVGGFTALAAGPHGHGPRGMGHHGDFGPPPHMMGHHHSGFSWLGFLLILILVLAVSVLVVKWLRRNSKSSAMQQFIDSSLTSSHRPLSNQSGNVLDQWERDLKNKN